MEVLLMASLPHLENLHFYASFRKPRKTEGLGQGGGDFTNTDPKHVNKAQSRSRLRKCSPQADPLENHTCPKRYGQGATSLPAPPSTGSVSKKRLKKFNTVFLQKIACQTSVRQTIFFDLLIACSSDPKTIPKRPPNNGGGNQE